ncbi:hypothetical protein K9M59_00580 [Candidatus Gracilibacteria bacterium]|nr:hypothetical protein [Candidatus Gracilibacteria bacterium]MCF7819075.1 hypothetical protein [Candidatus Gracilibacteria bacterium]
MSEPIFHWWEATYRIDTIIKNPKSFHSVQLQKGESVSGKIIAWKGPFIVIETPDELISICSKDLLGREIDFAPFPPGLTLHSALQNSLF